MTVRRSDAARFTMAAVFGGIGIVHFLRPEPFDSIIPEALPAKRALTYASGAAEIGGAVGLLVKPDRRVGWFLVALLLAVFPANINQAVTGASFPDMPTPPRWALWARLPFQALAIWAVLAATRPDAPDAPATVDAVADDTAEAAAS